MSDSTVVVASLSDDELQKSINNMVANFDKGLQKMVNHTNTKVDEIKKKLTEIGSVNFDSKFTTDTGSSKRISSNNSERKSVENLVNSYYHLLGAFKFAQRTERLFSGKNIFTLNREELGRYQKAVEDVIKLKPELDKVKGMLYYENADKISKSMAFDAKSAAKGFRGSIDERLNQLNNYYAKQEKLSQKAAQEEERQRQKRVAAMEKESAAQKKMIDDQYKLSFARAMRIPTDQLDLAQTKLERLQVLLRDMRERGILSNTQIASTEAEIRKLEQKIGQVNTAQQQTTQSAQRYTEEIRKQAQAIRERQQWKEKGFITADGYVLSNQENVAKKKRISLEEQILKLQQNGLYLSQDQATKEWQIVDANSRRVAFIQQENENLTKQRERVAEIANDVRNHFADGSFDRLLFTPAPLSGVRYIYQENDARAKGLTIEQQIEKILKEQSDEYERQAKTKKSSNSNAQKNISDIQAQTRAIEELLSKGKNVALLGNYKLFPEDMTGVSIAKQIALYEEQRKNGLIAANRELNLQVELANAIAQAEGKITQEVAKRGKKYVSPTMNNDLHDITRYAIANKLGIDPSKVINADAQYDSIKRVGNALKQLQDAYARMTNEERNSPIGKHIIRQMQELERQTQQLRARMSRPISLKDALSGSEKTLDDIAYKMQRLRAYKQGIDLTKPNAANEIKQVDEALAKLQKDADKWMSKSNDMIKSNTALGRSWNYMKNRLAFYFTVGASTQFIKNLVDIRSQYEMNERALGILINSAERGTQIFNELSQMALVSPYTLIELSSAAKQLTAYDVAAKDVVDTTRRLADMAAAVGIPIERLTYALGQIKAYGYLNSRDARMFANAGIPLVKQLSDYYTELEGKLVSTADVYDRIKKKTIDYNEVMEVMYKMTDQGGKFFDFQAKMADTLKVRLANLTLAWNNMLNDMGKESQGVLNWGIGALRELFLHWKQLDSLVKHAAWALAFRTEAMLLAYLALKVGAALGVTSKQMALSAVFGKRLAVVLKNVALSMKTILTSPLTWWSLLAIVAVEAADAILGVNEAQKALNESIRNGAKDNYDNISKFLEQYKEVRDSLYSTKKVTTGSNPTTKKTDATAYAEQQFGQDIDQNEAKKAWEAVREQIELTVASSDKYIENLLSISNMSERVRQGFNLLEDVQVVNAALKELDDDTIKVTKDFSAWWNLGLAPEGLIENLKDYQDALDDIIEKYGSVESMREQTFLGGKGSHDMNNYETALERFRNDLQKTTDSVLDFINLKGWSKDESKINQVFEQITQKLVLDNQLDPQKAFTLQIEVEEARSKAAKQALLQRINDERAAYKISHDEQLKQSLDADVARYNSWNETNGRSKVEWERFTKWLKEQHISETTAMFRNMDEEDIKSLNFQKGKHAEWVTRMVTQYAKEHKMSYDEAFKYLRSWVRNANQWSVFIPLIISSEDKKSVYNQLGEYDKAIDDADAQIERLTRRINELNAKKKKSKEETKELTKAEEELAQAQKDKASAEAKGGHGKKEKKDGKAANKAANKAEKQAESELQKALKDEITLINNARSSYDKLAKAGYKNKDILSIVLKQFGSTIAHINKVLGKNGIPLFDINSISGADNPKLEQKMLKAQIDAAKKARRAKPSEIKDLEVEYSKVTVDAKAFDFSQLTKQLENKANMLKDEYELSLEISSDPNLGNLFLNAFDINIDTLPSTAKEYADMLTVEVNKYLKGKNVGFTLPTINLTKDDIAAFEKLKDEKKISEEVYNTLVKYSKTANDAIKKENISTAKSFNTLYSQYADLDTKLTKVQQDAAAEQLTLIKKYGSSEDIKTALNLIEQMSIDATPADINRLSKQLIDVTNRVAKKAEGKGAIKLYNAINTKNTKDVAKTTWDDFKDSEYYSMMFDNMEKLSVNSISEIMAKLDELKDKVKEDPAAMKALMDAYNNAEKELIKKKPFDSIIKSLIEWRKAAQEVKVAQGNLDAANIGVKRAEIGLSGAQALGDKKAIAEATEKLTKAQEKQKKATKELRQAENQEAQAQSNFTQSLNAASSACSNVSSMLSQVVSLLGLAEDSDAAVVINNMAKAFSALGTVLGVVAAMAIIANTSLAWIGWAAMALSAIVGLLSSITNAKNNKINKQIKESELAVKRLENTYKNLEDAINNAFGASIIGAKQAAIENKKLQLVELERQLQLEQSRSGKHYDADKVEDLKGKVIDLRNELKNSMQNLSNDLLGISSVADAAQNFMKDYIDALRKGEDAQKVFAGSFKDMIATMITQLYVAKVVAPRLQEIIDSLNKTVTDRTKDEAKAYQDAVALQTHYSTMSNEDIKKELARQRAEAAGENKLSTYYSVYYSLQDAEIEELKKEVDKNVIEAKKRLDKASVPLTEDMDSVAQQGQDMLELMKQSEEGLKDLLNRYDLYDDGSNKNLSALQQGIQGITEDTAGALEAYMNGVSQQVYYHSSLLEQIRDAVVGFDMDVQMGTFSQMLLQLQNSYTLMQSMQTMMENWTIPSGSGIRVQLLS